MNDFKCPVCGAEGEAEAWVDEVCPGACGNDYYWDETYDDKTGDCWEDLLWTYWSREMMVKAKLKKEKALSNSQKVARDVAPDRSQCLCHLDPDECRMHS